MANVAGSGVGVINNNPLTDASKVYTNWIYNNIKSIAKADSEAAENVTEAFDIIKWFTTNWQLTILGVVAFLLLLKD